MTDREPLRTDRARIYIPGLLALVVALVVFSFLSGMVVDVSEDELEEAESDVVTVADPAFDLTDVHTAISIFIAIAVWGSFHLGEHHGMSGSEHE